MNIIEADDSVGLEAIKLFQDFLEKKFPKDYIDFLLSYNGGKPVPDQFSFLNEEGGSSVCEFLKINSDENYNDLLWNIRTYKERIPDDFIPIASDYSDNQICIAVRGKEYGKIYFWDHELEVDDGEEATMENMTLIANNFKSFLESLENQKNQ